MERAFILGLTAALFYFALRSSVQSFGANVEQPVTANETHSPYLPDIITCTLLLHVIGFFIANQRQYEPGEPRRTTALRA